MFELIIIIFFIWLFINSVGLAFKLTWGFAKLCAGLLMVLALPVLILCLLFAGGSFTIGTMAALLTLTVMLYFLFRKNKYKEKRGYSIDEVK